MVEINPEPRLTLDLVKRKSMVQFQSYLDNFFDDKFQNEKGMKFHCEKKLACIKNLLTTLLAIPVTDTSILVLVELPAKILKIINNNSDSLTDTNFSPDEYLTKMTGESKNLIGLLQLNVRQITSRVQHLTTRIIELQDAIKKLSSLQTKNDEQLESLAKPKGSLPVVFKKNLMEKNSGGYIRRRYVYQTGHSRK